MRLIHAIALLVLTVACGAGTAQVLPGGLPAVPATGPVIDGATRTVDRALAAVPADGALRPLRVRELLRQERARLDVDPGGRPVLRGEFLALDPSEAAVAAVLGAGFRVVHGGGDADALGMRVLVLRDLRARPAHRAMRDLRRAAPTTEFTYQHLYLPAAGTARSAPLAGAVGAVSAPGVPVRIGLVDGGVDAAALPGMRVERHGCEGRVVPQMHGTAVATRLTQGTRGTLYAADLWCGDRVGRATLGLVEALAWMARERVPVVNVSLVGPDNPVLARAVGALAARGHIVVAAAGNDGPAAPPLFPAAYPGVVTVSAVDERLRPLPESGAGPHVDFSANGVVDRRLRGTSFAAPVVARAAAALIREPSPAAARELPGRLAARARDLGAPGRDPRFGEGLIAD